MKQYPHIDSPPRSDTPIIAFDKLDGSNIRAEWNRKSGFYKFGRRHGLLDDSTPFLKEAEPLFLEKYGDDLSRIFKEQRYESAVAFFEFFGPNSFAGYHCDEPHEVVLFDIDVYKKGLLAPREFLDLVGDLHIPKVLYSGNCNQPFIASVRNNTLEGITFEGVVCKGARERKTGMPVLFKLKTQQWYDKLKAHCGPDSKLYNQLA